MTVAPDDLVQVRNLKVYFTREGTFGSGKSVLRAVDDVSFSIRRGETLGIVGESGCGKTTLGHCLLQLYRPTSGHVIFDGIELTGLKGATLRHMRRRMQIVFQDPFGSLNPRLSVGAIIAEPLEVHGLARGQAKRDRVAELLQLVGLDARAADRYPHEFSGGQRQRIGIARAIAVEPEFLICDEPVSALDVSIQAQILNLMADLRDKLSLTILFIAHDLSVVRHISDRILGMYLGKTVELANVAQLYGSPLHPYIRALLSAVPLPNPKFERTRERVILRGEVPSPANPPSGCRFHTRCPIAVDMCADIEPDFEEKVPGHFAACHLVPIGLAHEN